MAFVNTALVRMMTAVTGLRARMSEERGQDLLEYALLGGLIAVAIIGAGVFFQPALASMAEGIGRCIDFNSATTCLGAPPPVIP